MFCCRPGGVTVGAWDHDAAGGHNGEQDHRPQAGGECVDHCWSAGPRFPGNSCAGSGEVREGRGSM